MKLILLLPILCLILAGCSCTNSPSTATNPLNDEGGWTNPSDLNLNETTALGITNEL